MMSEMVSSIKNNKLNNQNDNQNNQIPNPNYSNYNPNSPMPNLQNYKNNRQDINYTTYQNFPNYYPNYQTPQRDSVNDMRPRGDSIFLPPPLNASFNKFSDDPSMAGAPAPAGAGAPGVGTAHGAAGTGAGPGVPGAVAGPVPGGVAGAIPGGMTGAGAGPGPGPQPNSRSNSVFNFLNLNPNDKKRLSSADNLLIQDFENYINTYGFRNNSQLSVSGPGGSSKDSLSNLLQFPFNTSRSSSQGHKDSKLSKNSSIDLSNPINWENQNMYGSLSGNSINYPNYQNNGSISNFLQGLTNSADFNNMSHEQRRDSILRLLNDPNIRNSLSQQTPLREDIFKKEKKDDPLDATKLTVPTGKDGKDLHHPLSPTSSLSSKSEAKYDVPQSPKASPEKHPNQFMNPNTTAAYYLQNKPPDIPQPPQPQPPQQQGYYRVNQYPNQYISPNYINYGYQSTPPQNPQTHSQQAPPSADPELALPAIEKTDKPKLGATQIDQLMLVIQARDKANKDIKIHTNEDGSIIGEVKPQHLIGGVEKNKLLPQKDEESDYEQQDENGNVKKRSRRKLPQCPYCDKFFAQSTQLEVHIRSHIGLKPFECSYCHKRFTQGGNLTTHLRLHTGEKPFTCDVCNKSFSRKGNLAAHKLTHEKLKPYDCKLDDCEKSFTQLGNLKSHQNKFHLHTLNNLTMKLAELDATQIANLPKPEQELLEYFKNLYKNSNKGIKGRGKRIKSNTAGSSDDLDDYQDKYDYDV